MPVFEYKGLNEAGKAVKGSRDADSPKTLRSLLRKDGVFLTEVVGEARPGSSPSGEGLSLNKDVDLSFLAGRIKNDDVAIMTRQLATLVGAGVTLVEALTALTDQVDQERLKRVVGQVKQRVNEGSSLADALAQHPKVFGALYVNMIRAGESSGALEVVLVRLADFTENQARLRQKVVGAMTYPAIMMLIGLGILSLLFTVVIPKVTKIFEEIKASLPFTTRMLIWSSDFARDYWYLLFLGVGLGTWSFLRWKSSPKGKPQWDAFVLRVPVFGPLVRMLAIARFTRTLATLLKSGVQLLTAMDIVKNIVESSVLSQVIEQARDNIREGESIAAPLKRSGQFPPLVYHMIAIGERSGQLEDMLVNVANAYDSQVEVRVNALTTLLEPVMIVFMGGIVAFIAFSILMPILQLNSQFR